jgi:hypothetical protein
MGPYVKKLTIQKLATDAIPPGGNISDGISFLSNAKLLSTGFRKAHEWVLSAINLIRDSVEPNPWKNASDEEIASELWKRVEDKKQKWIQKKQK